MKTKITLKLYDRGTGKKEKITCLIQDRQCLTRYTDMHRGNMYYQALRKAGINANFTRGIVLEHRPTMSREQLVKKIIDDFEATIKEMQKITKIKYELEQEGIE